MSRKPRPEFLIIPIYLYQNELDDLSVLPSSTENLVGRAVENLLKHPTAITGAFGGKMPEQFPLYVKLPYELATKLQNSGQSAEQAIRAFLNSISADYLKARRELAKQAKEGGGS